MNHILTFSVKKTLLLGLFAAVLCMKASAQTNEKALVENTIQLYFDGWMTGDTSKVGKAMHSTCHLKVYRDNVFRDISRTQYLSGFKPHPKEDGTFGRIKFIDFTGNIASAKCELETPKAIFTDYFNLIKVQDFWYIVDKVSTRVDK
jgi:aldose sugar dehydrogenase